MTNRSMPARPWPRLLSTTMSVVCILVCLLVALLAACGQRAELPPLEPMPEPPLDAVESQVRLQIEEARTGVDEAADEAARRGDLPVLADAYGTLGETYHAYRLWAAAAVAYENAERLDPAQVVWPYLRGVVAQEQGDFAAAADHLRRALVRQESLTAARIRLADALLSLGDAESAAAQVEGLASEPGHAAVVDWILGRAAVSRGDDEAAVVSFERVLATHPQAGAVHQPLAQALRRLGRADEAKAQLELDSGGQVPFPDPVVGRIETLARGAGAYQRRGNQALMAGRPADAADFFRQGVETDPENLELRLNLALALARAGAPAEAARALEETGDRFADEARYHHDLGTALRAAGRNEDAAAALRRAVELQPDYASAWFNLANALASAKKWKQTEQALTRHLELEPDDRRSQYLLAMAAHGQGRTADAVAALREMVRTNPADTTALQGLGQVLSEAGRDAESADVWSQVVDLDLPPAQKGPLLDAAARAAWRNGKRARAVDLWRQWSEIEPGSSQAFTALANAQQLSGDRRRAEENFARAVELDATNGTAWMSEISLTILRGAWQSAKDRLDVALSILPEHAGLMDLMARLLATAPDDTLRDGPRAVELAIRAHELEPTSQHAETLAMALAEDGQFQQAIEWQTRLAQSAQASGDRQSLARLARQLRLYQQGLPARVGQ